MSRGLREMDFMGTKSFIISLKDNLILRRASIVNITQIMRTQQEEYNKLIKEDEQEIETLKYVIAKLESNENKEK